jgi:hypothetical protein
MKKRKLLVALVVKEAAREGRGIMESAGGGRNSQPQD